MKPRSVRWVVATAVVLMPGLSQKAPGQAAFGPAPSASELRAAALRLDQQFQRLAQAVATEVGTDTPEGAGALDHARSLERVAAAMVQTASTPQSDPAVLRGQFRNIDQSWISFHQIRIGPPPLVSTPQALLVCQAIDQALTQLGAMVGGGSTPAQPPPGFSGPSRTDPLAFTQSFYPPGQSGTGVPPAPADLKTLAGRLDQQLRQLGQAVVAEVGTESLEGFGAFDHARNLDKVATQFAQTLNAPQPDPSMLRNQFQNINQSWVQYHTRLGTPPLISTPNVIASSQAVDQTVGMIGAILGYNGGPGPAPDPSQPAAFSFP